MATTTSPSAAYAGAVTDGQISSGELVVTGEAIALELRAANVAQRLMSGVIDVLIYAMVTLALVIGLIRLVGNEAQLGVLMVILPATMMVLLPTTVESLTRGLSAGKLAVGIRVVRDDGGPVRFRHALVRAVTGVVEIWLTFGALAIITAIINRRSKRLGDLLAGTYAIRVRGSEVAVAPLLMPPDMARWAQTADIRRIPDLLALHARVFLSRTGSLNPQVRHELGRQFAASIEPFVSPPPPWGTNPERFLAAVLVARRDREFRAGLRDEQRNRERAERTRRLPYGVPEPF